MFVDFLQNEEKMEAVAFLTDITSRRNNFNVKLQGRNNTMTSCLWCVLFRGSWRCLNLTYRREIAALSKAFGTNLRKKNHLQNHAEFLEKLIENFQTRFKDLSLEKQVLLCIGNPLPAKNVTNFSIEGQRICRWVITAALQTELIELRGNLLL